MSKFFSESVLAFTILWFSLQPTAAHAKGPYGSQNTSVPPPRPPISSGQSSSRNGFSPGYLEAKIPVHQALQKGMRSHQTLENITAFFNRIIEVPRPIPVVMGECGSVNAFYTPSQHSVVISYEIMVHFVDVFGRITPSESRKNAAGAFLFTVFHEIGHCLIHELNLPSTGREEDAVDEFATLLLIDFGEEGEQSILATALWFEDTAKNGHGNVPFWDEHSMDMVRFYNVFCLLYGAHPQKYHDVAVRLGINERRLKMAETEYRKKDQAWTNLLRPYSRNQR